MARRIVLCGAVFVCSLLGAAGAQAGSPVTPNVSFLFASQTYFATSTPALGFPVDQASLNSCKIDSVSFVACSSPFTPASLADGSHTFYVDADYGGQIGHGTIAFYVDTVDPSLAITAPEAGAVLTSNTPDVSFASDGEINECSFAGAPYTSCVTPFEAPPLAAGPHTLAVRATDKAGNATTRTVSFTIDSGTAPPQADADFTRSSSKVRNGKFTTAIKLKFLPSSFEPLSKICVGKISITLKPKEGKSQRKRVSLHASVNRCVASAKFKLPKKYKSKRATVSASGNKVLNGTKWSKTIKKL